METVILVIVMIVLVVLFIGVGALYLREAGSEGVRLWFTGSDRVRNSVRGSGASVSAVTPLRQQSPVSELTVAPEARMRPVAVGATFDDSLLRSLKEEIQRELRDTAGRNREFDARLSRIEHGVEEAPKAAAEIAQQVSAWKEDQRAEVARKLDALRESQQTELERLKSALDAVRLQSGSWGTRRGDVLADLYGALARVESALTAVINPMLLPGEPLSMPDELPAEAMEWSAWGDVGERAYALGTVYNEHRLVLDRAIADEVGQFIASLRHALTGSVYPAVRGAKPGADLVARMRAGIDDIVTSLPVVRQSVETAYRNEPTVSDEE